MNQNNETEKFEQDPLKTDTLEYSAPESTADNVNRDLLKSMYGANLDGYIIDDIISSDSGEAEIYKARKDNETVVIKYYHSNHKPKVNILNKIKALDHDDVIKLICFNEKGYNGRFYEIMEYAEGGTLADRNPDGTYKHLPLSEEQVTDIIAQVNNALKYIKEKKVTHRDIKPANLFLRDTESLDIVLGDFGISSEMYDDIDEKMTGTGFRTLAYSAPEIHLHTDDFKYKIGYKIDYYSLGITVFELLTGKNPNTGLSNYDIKAYASNGTIIKKMITDPAAKKLSRRMKQLLKGLLTPPPEQRWGAEQVDGWLKGDEIEEFSTLKIIDDIPYLFYDRENKKEIKFYGVKDLSDFLDQHREAAKAELMDSKIEQWLRRFNDELSDKVSDIAVSSLNDDEKVSRAIYLLNPERPCRIDENIYLNTIEEFKDILRKRPELMTQLILQEKRSDIFAWLNTFGNEGEQIVKLIENEVEFYRMEGDSSKRLSVVSKIYLSFAGNKIRPFRNNEYEVSSVNELLNLPWNNRTNIINELTNRNSILYLWLIRQDIPESFEKDWSIMSKTWKNLTEILSGNVEFIRKQKIAEAEKIPDRIRLWVNIVSALSIVMIAFCLFSWGSLMSDFYKITEFSPYAFSPKARINSVIYSSENRRGASVTANNKFIVLGEKISQSRFRKFSSSEMVPVKYYAEGLEKTGFMMAGNLKVLYADRIILFFFIPMIIFCVISLGALSGLLLSREKDSFYGRNQFHIVFCGIVGTVGLVSLLAFPLYHLFNRWKVLRTRCDEEIDVITGNSKRIYDPSPHGSPR